MLVKAQQNARGAAAVWKWKEKEEPIYAIDSHTMFFVNQDEATEQLLKIHQRNYNRAKRGVVGNTWAIPLVDNVFGLGKTTFGWEYIRNCQNMWDKSPLKTISGFLDTVRSCHTIKIEFTPQQLLGTNGDFDDMKALNNTIDDICSYFAENYGFRPLALAPEMLPPYCAHKIFPKNLTNEVGPLFIMIDEIGMAFNHIKLVDKGLAETRAIKREAAYQIRIVRCRAAHNGEEGETDGYCAELRQHFEASDGTILKSVIYGNDGFPKIHEIILLNLSTRAYRADVFGIQSDERLKVTSEDVVKKSEIE
ncbi:hypothetical protein PI125_g22630 [Phytophthora idaei]|nr:hypothetical protein PI125_g22630 [Phytophthora idaei]